MNELKLGIVEKKASSGSHFMLLYENEKDLVEAYSKFYSQGLKDDEFCMFAYKDPELMIKIKKEMSSSVDVNHFEAEGQILFLEKDDVYFEKDKFDKEKVYQFLKEELTIRKASGKGIRAGGDISWLKEDLFDQFADYEEGLTENFYKERMLILCAYPVGKLSVARMIRIMTAHPFVIHKEKGAWQITDSAEKELRQKIA
ncbi:MEDS domain-containing protein [Candidatus Woesearchaeota archaeon]|nr:MEDS domain-containing protein [Candidatus Woesearchaeota archaeon]